MDLIKTLEDDDVVHYASDESISDDEAQPRKKKAKSSAKGFADFDQDFDFVDNQEEYIKDTWSDMTKYLRKKKKSHRTTTDEKIAKVLKESKDIKEEDSDEGELIISDDELVKDDLNVRHKDARKKARRKEKMGEESGVKVEKDEEEDFFDDHVDVDADNDNASFYNMNLSRPLLKAIESLHFVHPTPIQSATIPLALAGRDICGCAATGTGKTAAYMLPVLERLLYRPKEAAITRVLVLVPTRELGVQVFQVTKQLTQFTSIEVGLSVGGLDLKMQESTLRKNPDIVIATPGRLIDHLQNTPSFGLDNIEVLILDEADRMLDECFLEQMKEIVKSCAQTRQTLLFSATMTDQVQALATVSLKKPVKIFVDSNKVVAWNLRQEFVRLRKGKEENRDAILAALVCRTFKDHTMVFIRTKKDCHRLHVLLGLLGVRVGELHGNMSQALRLQALKQFKEEEIDVLLTTDVAARGLDISGVKTVINYQLPYTLEQYIHRVGRTARAGRTGRSVSLADEEHRKMIREIIRNSREAVKNRVIPQTVVEKYIKKTKNLQKEVKQVLEEEQAEREIAHLENKANQMGNSLKNGESGQEMERSWFKDRKKEKAEAKKKKKQETMTKKKKKWTDSAINFDDPEERENFLEGQYMWREAKRKRRPKKIRAVYDEEENKGKAQKGNKRKKSAFEDDIANVKRTNVKRLRHEGNVQKKGKR